MTSFIDTVKQDPSKSKKSVIKIAYADFWPEWNQENFVQPILEKHYNVIVDQKNPDVLFHSIFNAMRDAPTYRCKKVLILFENWGPGQFGADYSISFDPPSERNFRLPLWKIYWLLWPEMKDKLFNRVNLENFERFCSFTVSNPANGSRISAFDRLNEYKPVHSYGKVRTNDLSLIKDTRGKYWRDAKDKFFREHPHKFMLTYENSSYPGYCTEKLMDAFLAGSIPIYWGDPKVAEDWNERSFVNMNRHNWEYGMKMINLLDTNQNAFDSMYNEPVFTDEQKSRHLQNLEEFESWLIQIIKS
jgi:alpha(1,3/1,4) fucosyltransferase